MTRVQRIVRKLIVLSARCGTSILRKQVAGETVDEAGAASVSAGANADSECAGMCNNMDD